MLFSQGFASAVQNHLCDPLPDHCFMTVHRAATALAFQPALIMHDFFNVGNFIPDDLTFWVHVTRAGIGWRLYLLVVRWSSTES